MNIIANKPYKPIWYSILLLIGLLIIGANNTIDIQWHDTYMVLASYQIAIIFSILLGIIGIVYWSIRPKRLISWMTVIHVLITVSSFLIIEIIALLFKKFIVMEIGVFKIINQIIIVTILTAILCQFMFLTNLVFSIIRNRKDD